MKPLDDKASEAITHLLNYCREFFYKNTICYGVINKFIIEDSTVEVSMHQKVIKDLVKNEVSNGVTNTCVTLAMART